MAFQNQLVGDGDCSNRQVCAPTKTDCPCRYRGRPITYEMQNRRRTMDEQLAQVVTHVGLTRKEDQSCIQKLPQSGVIRREQTVFLPFSGVEALRIRWVGRKIDAFARR